MDIEFSDLIYKVRRNVFKPNDVKSKVLLKSISGKFLSNQLTAIIGASGAGKTTLLNVLSGYKIDPNSCLTGKLKINGVQLKNLRKVSKLQKSICFIAQEDLLPDQLSVNESMMVAALLKLPKIVSLEEKQSIIDDILVNLNLSEHKSTKTSKLSGGQRKRLSIGLELINNTAIFFLDEPTSGLDNVSTMNCMKIFKKLSKQNRTLICTIHQPSASIFQLFDNVYVLSRGQCVYHGDTQTIVQFLSSINIACPLYYNPADFIIELTNDEDLQLTQKCTNKIENGNNTDYLKPRNHENLIDDDLKIIEKLHSLSLRSELSKNKGGEVYAISYTDQFSVLFCKMVMETYRNKTAFYIQLFHYLICALTVGLVFFNIGNDGVEVFNQLKFCMGTVLFLTYTQVMIPVLLFPNEIQLMKKEHFNCWYHIFPYYCALTLSKLPLQICFNYIFITITYIMIGFPLELKRFFLFSLVGNLVSFISESFGLIIGSIFDVTKGSIVGPALILPFLGLLVYGFDFMPEMSYVNRFLINLSFMRCGSNSLFLVLFGLNRRNLDCSDEFCFFRQPEQIIKFLSVDDFTVTQQITYLLCTLAFCRIFVYFVLKIRFWY